MPNDLWHNLQEQVAGCSRCRIELPRIAVECPPGVLYPPGIAPSPSVRVLFVGVAPPETGRHFYTDPSDNLLRGLLDILQELDRPCRDLRDFIARGFFLVHMAKCAIRGTPYPNLRVSKLCASTHLCREIECLAPDGICFLSKKIGLPVAAGLLPRWGAAGHLPFGEVISVNIAGKTARAIATTWPGREVHKPVAKAHVEALFSRLGVSTWQ